MRLDCIRITQTVYIHHIPYELSAHLVLSRHDQNVLGNFIGDEVKGKAYHNYPNDIAVGIKMHRAIDNFMDSHPVVKRVNQNQAVAGKFSELFLTSSMIIYCAKTGIGISIKNSVILLKTSILASSAKRSNARFLS